MKPEDIASEIADATLAIGELNKVITFIEQQQRELGEKITLIRNNYCPHEGPPIRVLKQRNPKNKWYIYCKACGKDLGRTSPVVRT